MIEYKLAPITAFRQIQEELEYIASIKSTMHLFGSSGFGKTVSIAHFIKNFANSFYIRVEPAETSRGFFSRFLDELNGLSWSADNPQKPGPTNWLIERTCLDIREKKKCSIIIIDEAGNLKKGSQSHLRQLIDKLTGYCAVVLAGPDRYRLNLAKWSNDHESGIPELMTRMHRRVTIKGPVFEDIELICLKNSIPEAKVIQFIFTNCSHLRSVKNHVLDYLNGRLDLD